MNDKLYNVLKWVGLVACPVVATFIGVIAPVWNLPNSDAIVTTINAVGVLIGGLIGVSTISYNKAHNSTKIND